MITKTEDSMMDAPSEVRVNGKYYRLRIERMEGGEWNASYALPDAKCVDDFLVWANHDDRRMAAMDAWMKIKNVAEAYN